MDMLRADRLNRITVAEDAARNLRNRLDPAKRSRYHVMMSASEGYELANAVAQALQAIREEL